MSIRNIVILGSSGSIGRSTLDVIDTHPGEFNVLALAVNRNVEVLAEQFHKYHPSYVCVVDSSRGSELADLLKSETVNILVGEDEMLALARIDDTDIVVNAIVGAAGLRASLETVKNNTTLALANKESLVAGGPLFCPMIKSGQATILPIDSEHSAIWQVLSGEKRDSIREIILTSSGGPFRELAGEKFQEITVEQALTHPTWKMGPKISIDSATLANKGLEVIEAATLFSVPVSKIRVVIHPQSIIHSMVEFVDSSTLAQLSLPDMRLPISYALFYPDRVQSDFGRINWSEMSDLTFSEPDLGRFPALSLAFEAAERGGNAPAIFNAANEAAVEAFLSRSIAFTEIAEIIKHCLDSVEIISQPSLEDIVESDNRARHIARQEMEKVA